MSEHEWGSCTWVSGGTEMKITFCKICGICSRDEYDKPCKGPTKLRAMETPFRVDVGN